MSSRRTVLKGLAAAGLAVGPAWPAPASAHSATDDDWGSFARRIEAEFTAMGMVGAAVAVVSSDRTLLSHTMGVRDLRNCEPVTEASRFLVASTTKSMSSLMVATFVDQGELGWDQPAHDAWPGFRAPTDELTHTLRVRDLLGMATGLDEPPALSALHEGDPIAPQLLQSLVNLPVAAAPNHTFRYNNTVYCVGGYLPLLHAGVSGDGLTAAFADALSNRVFRPVGMTGAIIADDPRGSVSDFMRGNGPDLAGVGRALAYGPVGSYAPAGGTLASLNNMAAYVRLQLRQGLSVNGRRVVSRANLAECWKPHIPVPASPELDPDVVTSGYGMGWLNSRYRDGTSLIWHNGGIDGFTSFIGFLPEHDIGLVVLNAMNPTPTGLYYYQYVLNLLLSEQLGLNRGVPAKVHTAYEDAVERLRVLAGRIRPTDPAAVAPYLGFYEGGYRLALDGRSLTLHLGPRSFPLAKLPEGAYAITGGLLLESQVVLERDTDGTPVVRVVGLETVRRTVGLP